ncbi:MAG: aminotransferase class IV [Bacteroidota bacterium]
MEFINWNGTLFPANRPIFSASHRTVKYGDGLFESIRKFAGRLPFLDLHYARLLRGMRALHYEVPDHFSPVFFQAEIEKLLAHQANARIRLSVFRQGAGRYLPEQNQVEFLIEASPLTNANFTWPQKGIQVDLCDTIRIQPHALSGLKTCNSLPYVLAALYRKERQLDDCLLLNNTGHLVEASSANLFLIDPDGQLLTPDTNQGAIAGTLQTLIWDLAATLAIPRQRQMIGIDALESAREVFLTNAIQGIRWVKSFRGQSYGHHQCQKIFTALQEKVRENPKNSV